MVGRRHEDAAGLLRSWGDHLLDVDLVLAGETLRSGPVAMEAIEVEHPKDHLLLAVTLYGPAVRALQLAWADTRGLWPWDPQHRARQAGQPLLGRRAPSFCAEHRPDRLDVPDGLGG